MTTEAQGADASAVAADAAAQTVSRSELDEAIKRRTSALDRARAAEERIAHLEAAQANRDKADKESQGRFQELAQEAEARAAAIASDFEAAKARLDRLSSKHRQAVNARFEALPEEARTHLAGRLGETPDLDAYEDAVSLAESLQTQQAAPAPRVLGTQPSAGKVGAIDATQKASIEDVANMTRKQRADYLKRFYK